MNKKPAYLILFILFSFKLIAQETILISGSVVDENNEPVPGVSIMLEGTMATVGGA